MKKKDKESNLLETIFECLPGNAYALDKDGYYFACNHNMAKIFRLKTPKDIQGKNIFTLLPEHQELAQKVYEQDMSIMEENSQEQYEEKAINEHNEEAIYLTKKVPLLDNNQDVIGLVGISIDITAEKKFLELSHEVSLMQTQINALKSQAASIAHEMRTPLSTINLLSSNMKSKVDELPPRNEENDLKALFKRGLDIIEKSIGKCFNTIDMILNNLTDRKDLKTKHIEKLDILTMIKKALRHYPFYKNEIDIIKIQGQSFGVNANSSLLENVFFNLIKNSLYALHNVKKPEIIISLKSDKNSNIIYFKDNGSGIEKQDLEKIFDNFFTKKPKSVGTGIGLSFCRETVKLFGGNITCKSTPNKHTTFKISFPKSE